jgi:predicted alpha/beta hydrolase
MNRVSIAGHSLGAHIAGLTGKRVRSAGRVVQVIFGLDPAGMLRIKK